MLKGIITRGMEGKTQSKHASGGRFTPDVPGVLEQGASYVVYRALIFTYSSVRSQPHTVARP